MNPSEKIRVAHVITTFSLGGATEDTLLQVAGLVATGAYEVAILAGPPNKEEGALLEQAASLGVDVEIVPSMKREIGALDDLRALRDLTRRLRRGNYHIVHTHSAKAGILGRFAGRLARVPVIIHAFHGMAYSPAEPPLRKLAYNVVENLASRITTGHTAVTRDLIRKAERARILGPGQCVVVRSGMDLDRFLRPKAERERIRASWGIGPTDVAMGTIGRVHYGKGQDVLVDLAPRLCHASPDLRILVIGTGPLREPLQRKVSDAGLERRVIFPGSYPPDQIPEVISALDMVIHISEREGLPRAVVQALACGKPVISYDLDGAPEVITDRVNGRLVRPHDPQAVYEAVAELAARPDLRAEWGAAGPPVVDPAFRAEMMVRDTAEEYRRLLARIGVQAPADLDVPSIGSWGAAVSGV